MDLFSQTKSSPRNYAAPDFPAILQLQARQAQPGSTLIFFPPEIDPRQIEFVQFSVNGQLMKLSSGTYLSAKTKGENYQRAQSKASTP
jgi:hypothetical protein